MTTEYIDTTLGQAFSTARKVAPTTVLGLALPPAPTPYRLAGSVMDATSGVALPVAATVVLLEQPTLQVTDLTHSDPVTGAYEFTNLKAATRYTVIARDYAGVRQHVIADNLEPTT